jgi:hypothetical protein
LTPRVIIEGLILAGVLWVGTSVNTLNAQMAAIQAQIAGIDRLATKLDTISDRESLLQSEVASLKRIAETNAERIRALEARGRP